MEYTFTSFDKFSSEVWAFDIKIFGLAYVVMLPQAGILKGTCCLHIVLWRYDSSTSLCTACICRCILGPRKTCETKRCRRDDEGSHPPKPPPPLSHCLPKVTHSLKLDSLLHSNTFTHCPCFFLLEIRLVLAFFGNVMIQYISNSLL